ncbi:MAG: type VI secretion system tube protein Hcp [Acidobacteria bacterium]|nr:type VI secretion system tube protein Hcp [Acidobacteriota bacterium]
MAIFIKFDGVDGESTKVGYEGWVEADHFSYGISNPTDIASGTGGSAGKPTISDVTTAQEAGRHTPELDKKICAGQHFAKIEIHKCVTTGEGKLLPKFKLEMTNAFVSSLSSSNGSEGNAQESTSFNAEKITREYMSQDEKGGLTTVGKTGYDIKAAQVI